MNEIIPFEFEDRQVRTVVIQGEPWFVAADVCAVLDIYTKDLSNRLDVDEKSYVGRTDLGLKPGKQMLLISVSGVFMAILRSDKEEAAPFKKWLTKEVLPALHKNGTYTIPGVQPAAPSQSSLESQISALVGTVNNLVTMVANVLPMLANPMVAVNPTPVPAIENQKDLSKDNEYLRVECNDLVDKIHQRVGGRHQNIWNTAYLKLNELCNCNIKSVKTRQGFSTTLEAVKHTNRMSQLHEILTDMYLATPPTYNSDF